MCSPRETCSCTDRAAGLLSSGQPAVERVYLDTRTAVKNKRHKNLLAHKNGDANVSLQHMQVDFFDNFCHTSSTCLIRPRTFFVNEYKPLHVKTKDQINIFSL